MNIECWDGLLTEANQIYLHLGDQESIDIWNNRVLFSFTKDEKYIFNISKKTEEFSLINDFSRKDAGAYIYGAGNYGRFIHQTCQDNFIAFIDQNASQIRKVTGLDVILPEEADNSRRVYISTRFFHNEVAERLKRLGFKQENLFDLGLLLEKMSNKQYFDFPQIQHDEREVFVDVGGFDGMTSRLFALWAKGCYEKIICFEPSLENNSILEKNMKDDPISKFNLIKKGAWNEKGTLCFDEKGLLARVSDKGQISIPVCKLDDELKNERVTFIKMDIEGAEYQALLGCERIIRDNKPKLAICVYHKPEDIFTIPQLILNYRDDYKLFFRPYTLRDSELVMYAI